ncbi:unnamed protein product [Amoebophrya sp. A25]|nr:unnamed protein product [Amoebophrya sp. A25]|eukprot:GSA25T00006301001.1
MAFRSTQDQSLYFHDLNVPHENFRPLVGHALGGNSSERHYNYDGSEKYDPASHREDVLRHEGAPLEDRVRYAVVAERAAKDTAEWLYEYQAARMRHLPLPEQCPIIRVRADPTREGSRSRDVEVPLVYPNVNKLLFASTTTTEENPARRGKNVKPSLSAQVSQREQRKKRLFQVGWSDVEEYLHEVEHAEKDPRWKRAEEAKKAEAAAGAAGAAAAEREAQKDSSAEVAAQKGTTKRVTIVEGPTKKGEGNEDPTKKVQEKEVSSRSTSSTASAPPQKKKIAAITFEYQGRPEGFLNVVPEKEKVEDELDLSLLQRTGDEEEDLARIGVVVGTSVVDVGDPASSAATSDDEENSSHSGTNKDEGTTLLPTSGVPNVFITQGGAGGGGAFATSSPQQNLLEQQHSTINIQTDEGQLVHLCSDERQHDQTKPEVVFPPVSKRNLFSVDPVTGSLRAGLDRLAEERMFYGPTLIQQQHISLPGVKSLFELQESNKKPPSALLAKSGHQKNAEVELADGRGIEAKDPDHEGSNNDSSEDEGRQKKYHARSGTGRESNISQPGLLLSRETVVVAAPLGVRYVRQADPVSSNQLEGADLPLLCEEPPDLQHDLTKDVDDDEAGAGAGSFDVRTRQHQVDHSPSGTTAAFLNTGMETGAGETAENRLRTQMVADRAKRLAFRLTAESLRRNSPERRNSRSLQRQRDNSVVHADGSTFFYEHERDLVTGELPRIHRRSKDRAGVLLARAEEILRRNKEERRQAENQQAVAQRKRRTFGRAGMSRNGGLAAALAEEQEEEDDEEAGGEVKTSDLKPRGFGQKGKGKKPNLQMNKSPFHQGPSTPSTTSSSSEDAGSGSGDEKSVVALLQEEEDNDYEHFLRLENGRKKRTKKQRKRHLFFRLYEKFLLHEQLPHWKERRELYLLEDLLDSHRTDGIQTVLAERRHLEKSMEEDLSKLVHNESEWKEVGRRCWRICWAPESGATAQDGGALSREDRIRDRRRKRQTLGRLKVVFDGWYMAVQTMMLEQAKPKPWSLVRDFEDGRVEYLCLGGIERVSIFGDAAATLVYDGKMKVAEHDGFSPTTNANGTKAGREEAALRSGGGDTRRGPRTTRPRETGCKASARKRSAQSPKKMPGGNLTTARPDTKRAYYDQQEENGAGSGSGLAIKQARLPVVPPEVLNIAEETSPMKQVEVNFGNKSNIKPTTRISDSTKEHHPEQDPTSTGRGVDTRRGTGGNVEVPPKLKRNPLAASSKPQQTRRKKPVVVLGGQ